MYSKILPHLKDLNSPSIDIEASALVSIDGLVMIAALPANIETEHFGGICAGAFLLGNHTTSKCGSGVLEQVLFSGRENQVLMMRAGTDAILATIIKPTANLDPLFPHLKKSLANIINVLG